MVGGVIVWVAVEMEDTLVSPYAGLRVAERVAEREFLEIPAIVVVLSRRCTPSGPSPKLPQVRVLPLWAC